MSKKDTFFSLFFSFSPGGQVTSVCWSFKHTNSLYPLLLVWGLALANKERFMFIYIYIYTWQSIHRNLTAVIICYIEGGTGSGHWHDSPDTWLGIVADSKYRHIDCKDQSHDHAYTLGTFVNWIFSFWSCALFHFFSFFIMCISVYRSVSMTWTILRRMHEHRIRIPASLDLCTQKVPKHGLRSVY